MKMSVVHFFVSQGYFLRKLSPESFIRALSGGKMGVHPKGKAVR